VHPHVIQFKEVFLTPTHLAIAMEYAPGGDLFSYVSARGGLSEDDTRWFFQQLIIGLDYCHRMGVVNRDIKLENTLLDGGARPLLKICDFGYSKNEKDSLPKSKVGTPGYTAPEVVSNARHYDGRAADVWSAAVMLYVMLFCEYPFERAGDAAAGVNKFARVLDRIRRVDYHFPSSIPVSDACKDLISRILVADVGARLTIEQIQAHPWYTTDLPPGVTSMNEQCLALRGQSAGTQSEAEIQRVVMQAIGARAEAGDDDVDEYIDEALEEDFE
jgi:serine/threonine-protein kinase SRK2